MMASWLGWGESSGGRCAQRDPVEVVTDTLMLELGWQLREVERLQQERNREYRRLLTGVDYSWLSANPRSTYNISTADRLSLEEICAKIPPSYCGAVILRFRQVLQQNEPEVGEVSALFRSVLGEVLERSREEEAARRLSRQWGGRRSASSSLLSFRSRVRIIPFGSAAEVKTVSEDVERGLSKAERSRRAWSMPEFRSGRIL